MEFVKQYVIPRLERRHMRFRDLAPDLGMTYMDTLLAEAGGRVELHTNDAMKKLSGYLGKPWQLLDFLAHRAPELTVEDAIYLEEFARTYGHSARTAEGYQTGTLTIAEYDKALKRRWDFLRNPQRIMPLVERECPECGDRLLREWCDTCKRAWGDEYWNDKN